MKGKKEKGVSVISIAIVCLIILLVPQIGVGYGSGSTPWPMFRHDVNRTGSTLSPGPATNDTLWTYTTGGLVTSSPAVVDGVVYVGSGDSNVYALDASTGAQIWNYTTGDVVYSSPAVVDDVVYVGSNDTNVYALDASTGAKKWNYSTYWGVWSSPAVVDGVVYIGGMDGFMYALNASTGLPLPAWVAGGGGGFFPGTWLGVSMSSSPAVVGNTVYIGGIAADYAGNVTALYKNNGTIKWVYPLTFGVYFSSPAVVDGVVYIGTTGWTVLALNATDGTLIWSYVCGDVVNTSPAVANGIVYVGSGTNDKNVYALNATTATLTPAQRKIWNYTTGGAVYCSPAVASNGIVYVGSDDFNFYALDASTGAEIWRYTISWMHGSAVVAEGVAYVGAWDNKLWAFGAAPVGGVWIPVDKLALLAPWIALTSAIIAAAVLAAVFSKRWKKIR